VSPEGPARDGPPTGDARSGGAVRKIGGGVAKVAGGAAKVAGGAVKGTVAGTVGVGTGARCVVAGISRLVKTPWLWPYGIAPVAIALLVFVGVTYWMVDSLVPFFREKAFEYTGEVGGIVATILGALILIAAALVAFYVAFPAVVRVFAAPFMALLSDRVYVAVAGHEPPPVAGSRVMRWVVRPTLEAIVLLCIRIVITVVALPLNCIPGVGTALFFAILLPIEGLDLMDLALSARGVSLADRIEFVKKHIAASSGLGLGAAGLLLIPVLNVFFLPALVVGAVLLDQKISPDFAAHVDALPGTPSEALPEEVS
jgi:CysZ protein